MQHHAYIYEGALSLLETLADDARGRFGFALEHSPDVHVRAFEKFGIEESRWLTEVGALKSSSGHALFIVGISSITSEAQQALLKLFEEPQEGSVYVLLVPHGTILPTLRSRMLPYPAQLDTAQHLAQKKVLGSPASSRKGSNGPDYFSGQGAASFLKLSGKDRSDFITKLLKDDDGQKERVREFLNALEAELYKGIGTSAKIRLGLEDIARVRDYVRDRSPSLKMLLEHLAVSLPLF
jgi:hypothetical protein